MKNQEEPERLLEFQILHAHGFGPRRQRRPPEHAALMPLLQQPAGQRVGGPLLIFLEMTEFAVQQKTQGLRAGAFFQEHPFGVRYNSIHSDFSKITASMACQCRTSNRISHFSPYA